MSLQARLRHTLGERWIELPERGVDQPIVVGRAGTADVQVPSVTVAQKHCVLFVHEGRWVVQEVGGGSPGTYVNGSKVDGAAFLHVGDVITLGLDGVAPALEIDPAGAAEGRSGQPAEAAAEPAHAAAGPAVSSHSPPHDMPPPAAPSSYAHGYPVYVGAYPVPAPQPQWPQQPAAPVSADGSLVDWPADAAPRYSVPRRRRRTSDGGSGVIIGMMLTLLITAGAGYLIYRRFGRPGPLVVAPPPATQAAPQARLPRDDPSGAPPSIFDAGQPRTATPGNSRPTARAGGAGAATATAPAPAPTSAAPYPTPDPVVEAPAMSGASPGEVPAGDASPSPDLPGYPAAGAGDDAAWKQVEAARHLKDEAKAILQFDDYARTHPGTNAEQIRGFTDAMLDRIWLERVENLCEQREELNRKIQEVDKELAEETDQAHKNRVLNPLRQQYASRLGNIEEELTQNMKYDGKSVPNLLDDAEVERLRRARDPQYFASWKGRVVAHIRRTHGELPWATAKSR